MEMEKEKEKCRTCKFLRARWNGKDMLPKPFCIRTEQKVALDHICLYWESMKEYKIANRSW